MEEQPAWSEDNSRFFINYGNYFVPEREYQFWTISELIPDPGSDFDILELCCGEGLLAEIILQRYAKCRLTGLDGSEEMLEKAGLRLSEYGERFRCASFDLAGEEWRHLSEGYYAVVSSLAIHHLDDRQKQILYHDVYQMLVPGGAFLIADIFRPAGAHGMAYASEAYDNAVRQRVVAIDGNLDAYDFFVRSEWNIFRFPDDPIDQPSALLAQLHWLKQAGFQDVDVYWLKAGHAIFGGRK